MFVRLTGCNLRCTWCDTAYAFHGGKRTTIDAICHQVDELAGRADGQHGSQAPIHLVELTGGEPLLQEGVYALAQTLLDDGYTVMIETSGERFIGKLPEHVIKIVDVKCPGAGSAANTFHLENLDTLTRNDEVKFVISNREDYDFARDFIRIHSLNEKAGQILLSPAFNKTPSPLRTADNATLDPRKLVEWMLADGLPARLSLQIHKFIWEPMKKGV